MKVLVTGGGGFIGSAVANRLLADGDDVILLERVWRPENYREGVQIHVGDIRDATSVTESVAHADAVIHLAGVLGTAETIQNPIPAAETNVLGGLNVLQAVAQYTVPCVNIAVGNWWESSSYSITKNTIERFCKMYRDFRGTPVTTVRALNAVGPGQSVAAPFGDSKVRKIGPSFICRALTGYPIQIYGSGDQIMDVIHVEDVANVLVSAMRATVDRGEGIETVFEAGTGADTTVNQIAETVARIVTEEYKVAVDIEHIALRAGETPGAVVKADTSTLAELLAYGVDPVKFRTLEETIADTVPYFYEYLTEKWVEDRAWRRSVWGSKL